jgi:hypothetical protein
MMANSNELTQDIPPLSEPDADAVAMVTLVSVTEQPLLVKLCNVSQWPVDGQSMTADDGQC